jgi:hypothetical protein
MPEVLVVLAEMMVVMVVVMVLVLLRMAVNGFEVMFGVTRRVVVVVVAGVSLFIVYNNWIVDGCWTWS